MSGEAVDSYADAAFGRPHTRCDPTFLIKSFKIITNMKVKKSFVSAIKEYTYTTKLMWNAEKHFRFGETKSSLKRNV